MAEQTANKLEAVATLVVYVGDTGSPLPTAAWATIEGPYMPYGGVSFSMTIWGRPVAMQDGHPYMLPAQGVVVAGCPKPLAKDTEYKLQYSLQMATPEQWQALTQTDAMQPDEAGRGRLAMTVGRIPRGGRPWAWLVSENQICGMELPGDLATEGDKFGIRVAGCPDVLAEGDQMILTYKLSANAEHLADTQAAAQGWATN